MTTLATSTIMELAAGFLDSESLRQCLCTATSAGHWCTAAGTGTPDADSARQRLRNLQDTSSAQLHRFVVASGSKMETHNSSCRGTLGSLLLSYSSFCTGMPDMPDWSSVPRHRRKDDAPKVPLAMWVKIMTRRVEQQLKRDWLLRFTMSNVLFRSLLNRCRTVYS